MTYTAERVIRMLRVGLLLSVLACAGCATPPPRLFSTDDLSRLVTGQTLLVQTSAVDMPTDMLLYLAPDGTGWLDRDLPPHGAPLASGMRLVLGWGLTANSEICLVATPRVGEMPAQMPLLRDCLQVIDSAGPDGALLAVVSRNGDSLRVPLVLAPGNDFPSAQTAAFVAQTSVLYGGRMPFWPAATLPQPTRLLLPGA